MNVLFMLVSDVQQCVQLVLRHPLPINRPPLELLGSGMQVAPQPQDG